MDEFTITIVDDDEPARESLALLLNLRGYRTRTFANAEACLAAWKEDWRGCYLLDLRMGAMDGLELQQALMKRDDPQPVVFLTGHGNLSHARAALKGGAVDFLEKPYAEEALLAAVTEALERDKKQRADHARASDIAARMQRLSPRERQVMDLVVAGRPNREIAVELDISPRTVEVFKSRMMEKMQARSVPDLVRMAINPSLA